MTLRDRAQGDADIRSRSHRDPASVNLWLLGVVLVGLAAGWVWLYSKSESQKADSTTLCLPGPPTEVVVFLLDMSSQLSKPQAIEVRNELARVSKGIPRKGLVEVYAVDRISERVTSPTVHLCNPGTGEELNRLYQNPDLAQRKWKEFERKLDAELNRQLGEPDAPSSPIFEAIQAVALRTFGKQEYDNVPKRLVIVSDLIQHVPGKASHYRDVPDFSHFKNDPYFNDVRANLKDVTITVFYLVRTNVKTQGNRHIDFWNQLFAAEGAILNEVTKVYGDR